MLFFEMSASKVGPWELGFQEGSDPKSTHCACVCADNVGYAQQQLSSWESAIWGQARQRVPMWPIPVKILSAESLSASLVALCPACCRSLVVAEGIVSFVLDRTAPGFRSADFALYCFALINLSHEYDYC